VARRTAVNYARKMSVVARGRVRGRAAGSKKVINIGIQK